MCIGIPMQVVEPGDGYALCEGMGERREINTMLVGDQPVGTWLLTFLDTAREILSAEDAEKITDAVKAVNLVMQGETSIDHLFADLIDREPEPPPSMPTAKH
ncbi:MAG: HypC/HybG/HupF family hydrogenase formation chaperone [Xanthomonadales bacterium]|nr:HypC/HybG/HupF family hydrogenase formation chaperone [Xanthomonadales bacterium]